MSTKIEDLPNNPAQPSQAIEEQDQNQTNVTMEITKKTDISKPSLWEQVKNDLNEDTLLIAIFIFLGTLPNWNEYLLKIPILGSYLTSDLLTGIVKAAILTVIFVIVKKLFKSSL